MNVIISRCCFADDGTDLFISMRRTCSTLVFLHPTNQILNLWRSCCGCHPRCQSSLIREFKQPLRRQRQEHHTFAYFTMKNNAFADPPPPEKKIPYSLNKRKTTESLALWELIKELENHFVNTRKKAQQQQIYDTLWKRGGKCHFSILRKSGIN